MSGRRDPTESSTLVILSPVYEDWEAVAVLLERIDHELRDAALTAEVVFVDDGSCLTGPEKIVLPNLTSIQRVTVVPLRRNLGHQRAIAIGLAYVEGQRPCEAVVVMDSDGEDAPREIPRLVQRMRETDGQVLVFAERTKRLEKASFQALYQLYRWLHHAFTGISVRVGNFSIVPARVLHRLVVVSELWNHYAAAVFASGIPHQSIPTRRSRRIAGRSRMNFVSLVAHGLAAISVHSERLAVRALASVLGAVVIVCGVLVSVLVIRLTTDLAIPGWASSVGLALLVLIAQLLTLCVVFVFTILHRRSVAEFLPVRDYVHYIDEPYELATPHVERQTAN
jgi:glycosyltransferase involved in cell wall biosynthesis